jgi:uncharacterized membrane protein YgdD (TMEM256/DUF423 family)
MRLILVAAVVMGAVVGLGAFGAHALKPRLEAAGMLHAWETAVLYQAMHGLAVFALGVWCATDTRAAANRALAWAGRCWVSGIVLFSGSLYALALGGPKFLGPVTPVGGVLFLVGWVVLAMAAWRVRAAR